MLGLDARHGGYLRSGSSGAQGPHAHAQSGPAVRGRQAYGLPSPRGLSPRGASNRVSRGGSMEAVRGVRPARAASVGARPVAQSTVAQAYPESAGTTIRRVPPSLSVEELNAFDVFQMGAGGGIKVEEIASPPVLNRLGGTSTAYITEESDLHMYRGGLPYSLNTPVLVRFESGALHVSKIHDHRHLISLPFQDIKKVEQWEGGAGHCGLRIFCGSATTTEVSLVINEHVKRNTLHKLLMLKTRGVILPINRDAVVRRRGASPSVRLVRNPSASVDTEDGRYPGHMGATSYSGLGPPGRYQKRASPSPRPVAASPDPSYDAVQLAGATNGRPAPAAADVTLSTQDATHLATAEAANMSAEEMDRERRRERIRQQLQDRRAEKARQEAAARHQDAPTPQPQHAAATTPQPEHAESPALPTTEEKARLIVDQRRQQRQQSYEDRLEAERRQRMMRRAGT
eukprot:TRINITY_DN22930_c0_g1_i1.p2 TRINITY_DN22930_c0_g1~~TRINITY_DN22930_c0_g1_i1.p2  ORF type:complete len:457 (+),score=136.67 TRINITY_DN22930_c0_g1_i1:133-1503(+)